MCYTPEIAAEVTLQPIRRFGLDAAIVFSDILTPLVPMGAELTFSAVAAHRQPGSRARRRRSRPSATTVDRNRVPRRDPRPGSRSELDPSTPHSSVSAAPRGRSPSISSKVPRRSHSPRSSPSPTTTPRPSTDFVDRLADAMAAYLRDPGRGTVPRRCRSSTPGSALSAPRTLGVGRCVPLDDCSRPSQDLGVPRIYFANGGAHLLHDLPDMPCEVIGLDWRVDLQRAATSACRMPRCRATSILESSWARMTRSGDGLAPCSTPRPDEATSPTSATASPRTSRFTPWRRLRADRAGVSV